MSKRGSVKRAEIHKKHGHKNDQWLDLSNLNKSKQKILASDIVTAVVVYGVISDPYLTKFHYNPTISVVLSLFDTGFAL